MDTRSEFPQLSDENRAIWEANAEWWDDRIGDGNDFQNLLIEPATERLLGIARGDVVLDIACGAGRFTRRMAALGAQVVAFDGSQRFIARARTRTPPGMAIEYHVLDAADAQSLLSPGAARFDKAVCTMALMDMPQIEPLLAALGGLLKPGGTFVFSVLHPCFHTARMHQYCELGVGEDGRGVAQTGVKVWAYLTPFAHKVEGIIGQPEAQYYFHRPIHILFNACFRAGWVMDGLEEPALQPPERPRAGVRWDDMPEIPPVMVVRMILLAPARGGNRPPPAGATP